MFEGIFKTERQLARHLNAPFAVERDRFIQHCVASGSTKSTVALKCQELLWAARLIGARTAVTFNKTSLHSLATRRSAGQRGEPSEIQQRFENIVRPWLRYLGWWELPKTPSPWLDERQAYSAWMKNDRGFCDSTISYWDRCSRLFLAWYSQRGRSLQDLTLVDFDHYTEHLAAEGSSRRTISNTVKALRSFVRFLFNQGWCSRNLASSIAAPRLYSDESLPMGPAWSDVERLIRSVDTDRRYDVRARAILMLLAIYGLRAGEVRQLSLEDFDWEKSLLYIRREKRRKIQSYPLIPSVGSAIVRYLREVRPASRHRELFLTLNSPHGPLTNSALRHIVAKGLVQVNASTRHFGPHSLRHACAGRLVSEGLSLKEIGDHLGHRGVSATRIYAKVDLASLREVAAFDLGGLL